MNENYCAIFAAVSANNTNCIVRLANIFMFAKLALESLFFISILWKNILPKMIILIKKEIKL